MEDHGLATNDQVSHFVFGEKLEERSRVGREVRAVYSDRCHARTSFASLG